MLDALLSRLRRRPAPAPCLPPCLHRLTFDWFADCGLATCKDCGEVFLAGYDRARGAGDWTPGPEHAP